MELVSEKCIFYIFMHYFEFSTSLKSSKMPKKWYGFRYLRKMYVLHIHARVFMHNCAYIFKKPFKFKKGSNIASRRRGKLDFITILPFDHLPEVEEIHTYTSVGLFYIGLVDMQGLMILKKVLLCLCDSLYAFRGQRMVTVFSLYVT